MRPAIVALLCSAFALGTLSSTALQAQHSIETLFQAWRFAQGRKRLLIGDRIRRMGRKTAYGWCVLGEDFERKRSVVRAINAYSSAIVLKPKLDWPYYRRARLKQSLGDHRGAAADATSFLKWSKSKGGRSLALFLRARSYARTGERAKAVKDLDDFLSAAPPKIRKQMETSAHYMRGRLKLRLGQKKAGCLDLARAGGRGHSKAISAIKALCR